MTANLRTLLIRQTLSIRDVMSFIDRYAHGVAVITNDAHRLIGIITDGDVRRAVLARVDLDQPVAALLAHKKSLNPDPPITVPQGTTTERILQLMRELRIRHIPIVTSDNIVVDVALLDRIVTHYDFPVTAVVFAGGRGTRMMPLTADLPKPMLPIGNKPILEHTVRQLQRAGIRQVSVTTHYRSDMIAKHFGDGSQFGLSIEYLQEDQPLGTAGALGGLGAAPGPLLVINGDILTALNFRAMLAFHTEHASDLTVAVREQHVQTPYGVVQTDGVNVLRIVEKPVSVQFINAGIYLLDPKVCALIPKGERYDMPDLINQLAADGGCIVSFPVREYWRDVGRPDDYVEAVREVTQGALGS